MKRYAVHPTPYVSFKAIVELHRVPPGECVNMEQFDERHGIDLAELIDLHPATEMKPKIKETIILSAEVEIQYDEGLREYAVDCAQRNCVMHITKWPMGGSGSVEVKTTGNVEEIKKP